MSDVNNPGLTSVEDEISGNPDANGGTAEWRPRETGDLEEAAEQGYPPAPTATDVFPTPADEIVSGTVPLVAVDSTVEPDAAEVDVAAQSIGQGGMVPVDPLDPAAGLEFRPPGEFVVVGPATSFQTNRAETDEIAVTVLAALDADALPAPAGATTTRFMVVVATPPLLTSFPVSLLGRQIVFADDSLTPTVRGAARIITSYGGNYVVIDRDDESEGNGGVASMGIPVAGDVFRATVGREGSEDVVTTGPAPANVVVAPPPPTFAADPAQALSNQGDVFVDQPPTGPIVPSGQGVPTATDHYPADQSNLGPGLPANVFA